MKINNCTKLVCGEQDNKKLFSTHISIETSIKSRIKINKGTYCN